MAATDVDTNEQEIRTWLGRHRHDRKLVAQNGVPLAPIPVSSRSRQVGALDLILAGPIRDELIEASLSPTGQVLLGRMRALGAEMLHGLSPEQRAQLDADVERMRVADDQDAAGMALDQAEWKRRS